MPHTEILLLGNLLGEVCIVQITLSNQVLHIPTRMSHWVPFKASTIFQIQSPQIYILPNKSVVRPTTIPQPLVPISVLVGVLLLWKDIMTMASLIKDNIELGLPYRFRGSVLYHQGGSMAASLWSRQGWEFHIFIWSLLMEDWLPGT
jgi:hypothetical protein